MTTETIALLAFFLAGFAAIVALVACVHTLMLGRLVQKVFETLYPDAFPSQRRKRSR